MTNALRDIEPVVVPRACGGYLATSAPGSPISIGVVGNTEDEAETLFRAEREAWATLSELPKQ